MLSYLNVLINIDTILTSLYIVQASCSQSFSGLGARSGLSFKMINFWTISNYQFKKTLLFVCIH